MKSSLSKYRERLKGLPEPLQKQIFIQSGLAPVFLLLFVLMLGMTVDWMATVPFIGISVYSIGSALLLFRRASMGGYVIIRGRCAEFSDTLIRKRTRSVLIETDEYLVRVILRQRLKRIRVGTKLEVYAADNTPVYDKGGVKLLQAYLAIKIAGGERNAKSSRFVSETENH